MNESSIGASTSVESAAPPVSAEYTPSSTTDTSPAQTEQTAGGATAGADQGNASTTTTEQDFLAGVPSLDELNQLDDSVQNKKSLVQMRTAIENTFKPKLSELETKLKPFENYTDRFTSPEEVQQAVEWHDKLFGAYERDPQSGQLVPATDKVAQELAQRDPVVADYLAADLMNGLTKTDDGREIPRIDLALEEIARSPERRAAALRLLGGVEPSSIAPTWQPTEEQLAVVNPEFQDIFRKMPYDERESLSNNDPEFINKYLAKEKFQADLIEQNRVAQERETQTQQRREQYFRQQAEQAGHQAVETGFKQLFTEYRDNVVENSKFIAPLDPNSPEAQQMGPEVVAQFNQSAQRVNTGVGKFIALATAALSVPDTSWIATDVLKELGVPDEVLQKFNAAREEYANNTRDAGELSFEAQQNRNGGGGLGTLQSNARRAASNLKATANLVSKSLKGLLSEFFEMKAGNYNQTLNGAATARPSINGTGFNPATAAETRPPRQPSEIWSPQSIERFLPR
jgi:hypothetical protein